LEPPPVPDGPQPPVLRPLHLGREPIDVHADVRVGFWPCDDLDRLATVEHELFARWRPPLCG